MFGDLEKVQARSSLVWLQTDIIDFISFFISVCFSFIISIFDGRDAWRSRLCKDTCCVLSGHFIYMLLGIKICCHVFFMCFGLIVYFKVISCVARLGFRVSLGANRIGVSLSLGAAHSLSLLLLLVQRFF